LIVFDVIHEYQYQIDFDRKDLSEITFIEWSPDKAFALIYAKHDLYDVFQLWLFSSETGRTNLLSNNAFLPLVDSRYQYAIEMSPPTGWKPDSTEAVFVDTYHAVWRFDVSSGIATELLPAKIDWYTRFIDWRSDALYVGQTSFTSAGSESKLFRFDDHVEKIWLSNKASYEMSISPNSRFVATTTGSGSLIILPIGPLSDENVEVTEMLLPDTTTYIQYIDEILWHPTSDWLFLFSDYAGHYYVTRQINILSADGSTQRYLTECHLDETCFGWLPE
jgi:hypothetical protein